MADKAHTTEVKPAEAATPAAPIPPRRSPGHRGQDVRDAVAEMAARAQEISLEAGSKMSGALRDVIHAAAGLAGFAVESARDLVQYMVRRGQMTQEDADKLIRDAEDAARKNKRPLVQSSKQIAASKAAALKAMPKVAASAAVVAMPVHAPVKPAHEPPKKVAASKPHAPAKKSAPAKKAAPKKPAAKKPAAKKPAAKKPAPKKAAPAKKKR